MILMRVLSYNNMFLPIYLEIILSEYYFRKEVGLFTILIFMLFLMGLFSYLFLDAMLVDCVNLLEHAKGGKIK